MLIVDLSKPVTLIQSDYTVTMVVISRSLPPKAARYLDLHCCEIRAARRPARRGTNCMSAPPWRLSTSGIGDRAGRS